MPAKKPVTKKPAKPKSVKPASRAGDRPTPLKDTAAQRTHSIAILADHVYRGPHHGKPGVSDLRVVSIAPGKDMQGKQYRECVTVEPTKPPHREQVFSMVDFQGWVRSDVTKGYEKIPKSGRGKVAKSDG